VPQKPDPIIHVTVFEPRPGQMDPFIARQTEGLPRFGVIPGWRGSTLYRDRDGRKAILVTVWDDETAHRSFTETDAFRNHREGLIPLLEGASGGFYDPVYRRAPAEDGSA